MQRFKAELIIPCSVPIALCHTYIMVLFILFYKCFFVVPFHKLKGKGCELDCYFLVPSKGLKPKRQQKKCYIE